MRRSANSPRVSQSSYYGDSPVQRNAKGSPAPDTVTAQPSHQRPVFPTRLFWCVSIALGPYSSSHLCAPRPSISLILDLIALPLTYEFITHTSFIGNTHAIYREAGHASICAYRNPSFPICQLRSHNITLSHCFFLFFPMTL